jgi:hypothetical protein
MLHIAPTYLSQLSTGTYIGMWKAMKIQPNPGKRLFCTISLETEISIRL